MTTPNLPIENVDFDGIKTSLKDFLRNQERFKDYDFEGSGMNILLDLLAYNTHYQAYYANMVANESFIDSAVKRQSVVSLAKHLGYTPRSHKASTAVVDVVWSNPSSTFKTKVARGEVFVLRGDAFTANSGGSIFTFIPLQNYKVVNEGTTCVARNVEIKEGRLQSFTYIVNETDTAQRFIIPETKIDTNSLRIRITKSARDLEGINDIWRPIEDINSADSNTNAYFLQEVEDGQYQILFGDGIIGRKPMNGNAILIEYIVTRAGDANGIQNFRYAGNIGSAGVTPIVFPLLNEKGIPQPSFGGSDPEDTESIRYYAPRNYQAQERTVTAEDYKAILTRDYKTTESILVWGGEENDPPEYGKVFIAIKPFGGQTLSTLEKLSIQNTILQRKNILGIIPQVVDPDYTYIVLDAAIKYDPKATNLSASDLEELISQSVDAYASEKLGKFGLNFRFSKFVSFIDGINQSFTSTEADVKIQKRFEPDIGKTGVYTIKFNFDNEIYHPIDGYPSVISSSAFGYIDPSTNTEEDAYLEDDGYGIIRIFKYVGDQKIVLNANAGVVNYKTGVISLVDFNPTYLLPSTSTQVAITAVPLSKDISTRRNQVLIFDRENSSISVIPDSFRTERLQTGASFPTNR